jgi:hypothetical protein
VDDEEDGRRRVSEEGGFIVPVQRNQEDMAEMGERVFDVEPIAELR